MVPSSFIAHIFSETIVMELVLGQLVSVITSSLYQCLIFPLAYSTTIYSWLLNT